MKLNIIGFGVIYVIYVIYNLSDAYDAYDNILYYGNKTMSEEPPSQKIELI